MKYALGIDVGGSKIAAGLVDKRFKVSRFTVVPTSKSDLLGQLRELIAGYDGFDAIGLGMPGQVLPSGVVRLKKVLWKTINLKKVLENKFKVPVSVVNDAKAFALAEARAGSGKSAVTLAGMILGTGIGVGFVRDKKIYEGKDGVAGELDHITMLDGKSLHARHRAGGKFINANSTKKYLKVLLDIIVLTVNPEMIVLGGAWSKLPGMEKLANELTTNAGNWVSKTPVKVSKLKHAGIIGAALPLLKK